MVNERRSSKDTSTKLLACASSVVLIVKLMAPTFTRGSPREDVFTFPMVYSLG
jgi:hypothetical protein